MKIARINEAVDKFTIGLEFIVHEETDNRFNISPTWTIHKDCCTVILDEPKVDSFRFKNLGSKDFNKVISLLLKKGILDDRSSDDLTKTMEHVQPEPVEKVKEGERIPFDLEKWNTGKYDVIQRNGMCTRILCTDLEWKYPIATYNKDSEQVSFHTKHGMTLNDSSEDDSDLFLIPKTETVWVNIWHTFLDSKLESEIDSKKNKFNSRFVKTIEIKKPIE